jgi:hypothetical protein
MLHSYRARHWRATAAVVAVVALCGFPAASLAEATLRYNYGYACNGERIVVGHCRRDSDMPGVAPTTPEDDFCQLYYPDRPKRGGFDAMGMELRGDLIKILKACGAFGSTQPASKASQSTAAPQQRVAPAPAAPPAAPSIRSGAAAVAAPGIGSAPWRNLAFFDDLAYFVLSANLQPGRRAGRGWFLVLQSDLRSSLDGRIAQTAIIQQLWTADCVNNTISMLQSSFFNAAGAPLGDYVVPSPESVSANPSGETLGSGILSLLCSRRYELSELEYSSDAVTLRERWLLELEQKASAPARAAAGSSASAPAATAPGGRPPVEPMPIGPEMCPLLGRLEGLAREDFRSIDRGPDRASGKGAETFHRTSMPIPGANCGIDHPLGVPAYSCNWPQATEKEIDAQFVSMVKTLEKCTGGSADFTQLEFGEVTVKVRGIAYYVFIINDFLALAVSLDTP